MQNGASEIENEVLQKFINYQTKIAIIGDFSGYTSKSLKDFIYAQAVEIRSVCGVNIPENRSKIQNVQLWYSSMEADGSEEAFIP